MLISSLHYTLFHYPSFRTRHSLSSSPPTLTLTNHSSLPLAQFRLSAPQLSITDSASQLCQLICTGGALPDEVLSPSFFGAPFWLFVSFKSALEEYVEEVSDIDFVSLAFVDVLALEEVLEVEEKRGMVRLFGDDNGNFCS